MKKLIFILMLALAAGAAQAQVKFETKSTDAVREMAAKYDVDKTTGKELLKRYGSGAIPLYLVFDTQGELLGRIQGAAKPDEFINNLQTILDRQKPKQGK